LSPDQNEEAVKKLLGEIEEIVKKDKGEWGEVEEWGKRKLSYSIKNRTEGYYFFLHFKVAPKIISEIKQKLKLKEEILRILFGKVYK